MIAIYFGDSPTDSTQVVLSGAVILRTKGLLYQQDARMYVPSGILHRQFINGSCMMVGGSRRARTATKMNNSV
jgi:hypothetical protein